MTSETEALQHIHTWRQRLSDQTLVSASEVQNRLFDLYGDLEPLPQLDKLKPWISLTVQRELFTAAELDAFLDELAAELGPAEPIAESIPDSIPDSFGAQQPAE